MFAQLVTHCFVWLDLLVASSFYRRLHRYEPFFLRSVADLTCKKETPNPSNPTALLDMTCDSEEQTTQKQLQILPEDLDVQDLQSHVTDENIITYVSGYLIRKISAVHN